MCWTCNTYGRGKKFIKNFIGKSDGKRQLVRPSCRQVYIKVDVREISCEGLDGIHLAQNWAQWRSFVNKVMELPVP